jgi:carbon monoxide dehydrogenase subunit G
VYIAKIRTDKPPIDCFAYLADLRNFADWDPGVVEVTQTRGSRPGVDARYDVTVLNGRRRMTLGYRTNDFDPPSRLQVTGTTMLLTSIDTVTVERQAEGTLVTYEARLRLRFPLSLADPLLSRAFRKIGDRAAAGLEAALDGVMVA